MTNRTVRNRLGLTLMELVVVMTILVALASILIPILPGMLNRAHTSTGATNVSELNKAVQLYEQMNFRYPDQLDALTDGTAVPDYLGGASTQAQLSVRTLTATDIDALNKGGITTLNAMHPTKAALATAGGDATFNPYANPTPTPIAVGGKVIQVQESAIENLIVQQQVAGNTYGDVYVVFGVGARCTLVGKGISQAPLHFPDNPSLDPSNSYGRFGLTFRIARGTGASGSPVSEPLGRAEFVGVIEFHETSIASSDGHIQEFYNSTR